MSEKYIKTKLEEIENKKYRIIGFDTDVGIISLSDNAELYFEIKKGFRGKHLAASAVYAARQKARKHQRKSA